MNDQLTVPPSFLEAERRICRNCHYFNGGRHEETALCAHPDVGGHVDPVFGDLRSKTKARDMRADGAACGPTGLMFVRYERESRSATASIARTTRS